MIFYYFYAFAILALAAPVVFGRRLALMLSRAGKRTVLLGTVVLAGFAATRLALLWRFPPFTDEALYAQWACRDTRSRRTASISLASGKEPLLPWAAMGWIRLGATRSRPSDSSRFGAPAR